VHVPLFGLAPSGVCPAAPVASCAVRSYRTISPLPAPQSIGGIFSVALSVGSLRPGVTWHSVLWSPDFPLPQCGSDHLANSRLHVSRFSAATQARLRWITIPAQAHLKFVLLDPYLQCKDLYQVDSITLL